MIIVDNYLKKRESEGNPIRIGVWGAGEMAKGMVNQIMRYTPGMEVAVIANRTISKALDAYAYADINAVECNDLNTLQECISSGGYAVTSNASLLCEVEGLDLLVECTGTIDFAAELVMKAIDNRKNVLLFNPEIDATVGPILKVYADKAGVMLSGCDGDQPGVIMNLYRFVKGLGLTPVVLGNIKGLQDFYRNPTTQAGFAAKWHLTPEMVTSFADGTKISIEQACVANATGMGVSQRGMTGINYQGHIDEMTGRYDVEKLKALGGVVDFVVGPKPGPGVFIYATTDDPKTKHYLSYGKLGDGPLYSFYTPYHLIYFEIPFSIARMVLFNDIIMAPIAGPVVDVITLAKTDLKAGTTLDGIGKYHFYGQCENSKIAREQNLIPVGLAEGAVLIRDIPRDQAISFDDVIIPQETLSHRLFREQTQMFFPELVKQAEVQA